MILEFHNRLPVTDIFIVYSSFPNPSKSWGSEMNSKHNLACNAHPSQGSCNQTVWEPSVFIPMHPNECTCSPHVPLHFVAKKSYNQSHKLFLKDIFNSQCTSVSLSSLRLSCLTSHIKHLSHRPDYSFNLAEMLRERRVTSLWFILMKCLAGGRVMKY